MNNKINEKLIFKNKYHQYGIHYFGWEGVLKSFLKFILDQQKEKISKMYFKKPYFFDEWIEKLLLWETKRRTVENLRMIEPYRLITFIHNPPYEKYMKMSDKEKKKMEQNIMPTEFLLKDHLNEELFGLLEKHSLGEKIVYLYTLSNNHKEYLYFKYPQYRNKLVSVYHPIEMKKQDIQFDFESFIKKKKIIHIGWWLRNFKTFVDFSPPCDFDKYILIKKCVLKKWKNISASFDLKNIKIIDELKNEFYEKFFQESCVFLDLEDAVANNVILECIRFNTPIIIKKIDSIVEYLGFDYPLYFSNQEDLKLIEGYSNTEFIKKIADAHHYLLNMDKSHIELTTFHKKIFYDLQKLTITENTIIRLTWSCILENNEDIQLIDDFIYQFLNQESIENVMLIFFITQNVSNIKDFLQKIEKYNDKNISYLMLEKDDLSNYSDYLNLCINYINTDYLTFVSVTDTFHVKYSGLFIDYLDQSPACDFAFSSFILQNQKGQTKMLLPKYYEKDSQLFIKNMQENMFPSGAFVWRKTIHTILGKLFSNKNENENEFTLFMKECVLNHLNFSCTSNEILSTHFLYFNRIHF